MEKYVSYQVEHENEPLKPGAAFPFVKVGLGPGINNLLEVSVRCGSSNAVIQLKACCLHSQGVRKTCFTTTEISDNGLHDF